MSLRRLRMLLPDKYVTLERSLLGQAAALLDKRSDNQTISELWAATSTSDEGWSFSRFALALSLLYGLGAVEVEGGILKWSRT
ncbi:ABC-three component system middle component 6 [Nocardia abscessus]|uniref:ABC-three component system middle component 6 n=1 Tax=Nocardia abscessus TaxID=120957 RepID=UPI00397FB1C0